MKMETIKNAIELARNNQAVQTIVNELPATERTERAYLFADATVKVGKVNEILGQASVNPLDYTTHKAKAEEAISAHNEYVKSEHLKSLASMPIKDSFAAYLADQTIPGAISLKEDEGVFSIATSDKDGEVKRMEVSYYEYLSTVLTAFELKGVLDAVAVFADNLAKNFKSDDSAFVSMKNMTESYINLRKRLGWTATSRTQLDKQANQLVNEYVIPRQADFHVLVRTADWKFIQSSALIPSTKANENGYYQKRRESALINFIFRAVFTRNNNAAYTIESSRVNEKEVRTGKNSKQEEKQSKARNAQPKADAVKVKKEGNKAGKKTTANPAFENAVAGMVSGAQTASV